MFLFALLLTACDCSTSIALEYSLDGERCRDLEDPGACCPDGAEYLGLNMALAVCRVDECRDVAVLTDAADGVPCASDVDCCPDGYGAAGFEAPGALVCVEGLR